MTMATILLVEDELELARLVTRELEAAGYRVLHAPDGATALRLFVEETPDLMVLDWMLPGMDGLELLRRVRQASPLPVLMLTARAEEVDRVVGLEVGADDYLTKPLACASCWPACARCCGATSACKRCWKPTGPPGPRRCASGRSSWTRPATWRGWVASRWT
jgi:CheY-like chemotaxis protein